MIRRNFLQDMFKAAPGAIGPMFYWGDPGTIRHPTRGFRRTMVHLTISILKETYGPELCGPVVAPKVDGGMPEVIESD